jgi:ATP-dependent Zn protease
MMQSLGFTSKNKETGVLILVAAIVWIIATVRVIVPGGLRLPSLGFRTNVASTRPPDLKLTRPTVTFVDVGGMGDAKAQIRQVVENRLRPGKFGKYGVIRNGILLHCPRGSGKTFLGEATAGEFGLNYFYVSSTHTHRRNRFPRRRQERRGSGLVIEAQQTVNTTTSQSN